MLFESKDLLKSIFRHWEHCSWWTHVNKSDGRTRTRYSRRKFERMVLVFAYPNEIRKCKGWTLYIKSLAFQKALSFRECGVVLMLCGSMMQTRPLMSLMMQTQSLFELHFRVRPSAEISFSHFILSPIFPPLRSVPRISVLTNFGSVRKRLILSIYLFFFNILTHPCILYSFSFLRIVVNYSFLNCTLCLMLSNDWEHMEWTIGLKRRKKFKFPDKKIISVLNVLSWFTNKFLKLLKFCLYWFPNVEEKQFKFMKKDYILEI